MKSLQEIEKILKENSKKEINLPCNTVRQLIGAFRVCIYDIKDKNIHYAFDYLHTRNNPDLADIIYVMNKLMCNNSKNSITYRIAKRVIDIIE